MDIKMNLDWSGHEECLVSTPMVPSAAMPVETGKITVPVSGGGGGNYGPGSEGGVSVVSDMSDLATASEPTMPQRLFPIPDIGTGALGIALGAVLGERGCGLCVEAGEPCCMMTTAHRFFADLADAGGPTLAQIDAVLDGRAMVVSVESLEQLRDAAKNVLAGWPAERG